MVAERRNDAKVERRQKNFSGSFKKLIRYIGNYKFAILAVMIFAAISTVFSVAGPKVMGKATTALAEGLMKKIAEQAGLIYRIGKTFAYFRIVSDKYSV